MKTTNNLIYKTSKTVGKEVIYVNIRLNDECKNGHEDFSITGDIYEAGQPKIDRYHIAGGCIHSQILAHFPEFKIFIELHLSDFKGIPMYAIGNGFYHLKNTSKIVTMDFLRITKEEFNIISDSEDEEILGYHLFNLGVIERWNTEAKEAIELLESLTGEKFKNTGESRNLNINKSTIDKVAKRISEGYYSKDKIKERLNKKNNDLKEKKIKDLKEQAAKEIKAIEAERDIKLYVLSKGMSIDNFIFYKHSKEAVFNWIDYEKKITKEDFEIFIKNTDLPKGVSFKLKG
jgi:hypothetical protein